MDGAAFLDGLVASITGILSGGYSRLAPEVKRLFEIIVALDLLMAAFAWSLAYLEVFQRWTLSLIKLFIWAMIFTSYPVLSQTFIEYCIAAGLTAGGIASGGSLTVEEFQSPSTLMMKGFEATVPINKFIQRHTGMAALKNFWNLGMMSLGALALWAAFVFMSVHLVFVQIILAVVVALGFAFIIFGALGITNFLAERAFGLIIANAARLGVAALLTALMFPFVDQFFFPDPSADPDVYAGAWVIVGSWLIAIFCWLIPSIAHGFFAGGPVLGLSNLVPGAALLMRSGGGSSGAGRPLAVTNTTNNNLQTAPALPPQRGTYL